jgi:hypothetical protein
LNRADRVKQNGNALEGAELANEHEVRSIRERLNRLELGGPKAVVDHRDTAARRTDLSPEGALGESAFEDRRSGERRQRALNPAKEKTGGRARAEMEDAAMRRVEGDRVPKANTRRSYSGSALRAMSMHDLDIQPPGERPYPKRCRDIAKSQQTRHGHRVNPERGVTTKPIEPIGRHRVAAHAVDNDTQHVAAPGKFLGQVIDVPKQAADRRAQNLEDPQRPCAHCGKREPTTMVSPGNTGKSCPATPLTILPPTRRWITTAARSVASA